MIKTIGVITPGGDAPGMNTAIRAVVRTAIFNGLKVMGIERGYSGLVGGDIFPMDLRSVSGIINRGGTILKTMRCPEFKKRSIRKIAARQIKDHGINALVIIGGNGSLGGAYHLYKEFGIPSIVIPASIDNDVPGTDISIGFDTAVNTALDAIDKIRDTATSHGRVFVIEVMGRKNGFIALEVGLSAGAEIVIIPEVKFDQEQICRTLSEGIEKGKTSSIVVVAEGVARGEDIAEHIRKELKLDVRVTVLGHIQRGGAPSSLSRLCASRFGAAAVEALIKGRKNLVVGIKGNQLKFTDISAAKKMRTKVDLSLYKLAAKLSI